MVREKTTGRKSFHEKKGSDGKYVGEQKEQEKKSSKNAEREEKENPDGEGGRETKRQRITGEKTKGRNREHGK